VGPRRCLFSTQRPSRHPIKSNLARLAPSLKYRLDVHPLLKVCRVVWTGTSPHRADRLIRAPPTPEQREEIEEARTKQETCGEYPREILRDGPVEVRLVKTGLGKAGFAVRTVERAARGARREAAARHGGRTQHVFVG
jgi:hypothetical protein